MTPTTVNKVLVDARNFDALAPQIIQEVGATSLVGYDLETEDSRRHKGLNDFMKVDAEGFKSKGKKLVFDTRRTTITGFSIYADGAPNAYYVNLAHADVANRVPWSDAKVLVDAKSPDAYFVAHNAPYEITMMKNCLDYDLDKIICSMQMAVSAYGADEYNVASFIANGLGGIKQLVGSIAKEFASYDPSKGRDSMTPDQAELFSKVVSKTSDSEWSYNGLVSEIAYGHGLKQAVKTWFGYQMQTFEQTLGDKAHMGQLTGEETAAYGVDDAYWAVRLYHRLLAYMMASNPAVVPTFFNQELPMVRVYADAWRTGMRVNYDAIAAKKKTEQAACAQALRTMKAAVKDLLPFPVEPNEKLVKHEKWYAKNANRYRSAIVGWANKPSGVDDFSEAYQVRGPVSNGWAEEQGLPESNGPNFSHYMPIRTILYDLIGTKLLIEKGKVQSDAEARGKIQTRIEQELKADAGNPRLKAALDILTGLASIAGIEQRMKLYLKPYSMLADPETHRVYPVLSSQLVTRRMATSFPNPMALQKRGEGTYVRGFYLPDGEEDVIVSSDWSGVELVLIGDASGDPEFKRAFGQLPYQDLHSGTAADILSVEVEGMNETLFKSMKAMPLDQFKSMHPRLITNLKGELLASGAKAFSYWRNEAGKDANFNYWYSGALSTIGIKFGWSSDMMWEATDRYRKRFAVAEQWRVLTIEKGCRDGYTQLPDGHRRVRFEATDAWREAMWAFWNSYQHDALSRFGSEMVRAIQTRAKNQIVNANIQGSCATLAKRSIPRINAAIKKEGIRARFMLPIHDELLYNCHRDDVLHFVLIMKRIMCDHPDVIKTLPMHCTTSVGRTFEPFDQKKVPFGQIELDEAPAVPWLPESMHGKVLDKEHQQKVIDYLFDRPMAMAA